MLMMFFPSKKNKVFRTEDSLRHLSNGNETFFDLKKFKKGLIYKYVSFCKENLPTTLVEKS